MATQVKSRFWETSFDDDRQALIQFVQDLWANLEQAFVFPSLLVSDNVAASMLEGIQDLRPAVEVTRRALTDPAWISDVDLDRAGLVGTQLTLKLDAYRTAETEYIEARNLVLAQGSE